MIEKIKKELENLKDQRLEFIIDEGRSRKKKENGIITGVYKNHFTIKINEITSSFSYADIMTESIKISKV